MKIFNNIYSQITTLENILQCFEEFKIGKKRKIDVLEFERNLEDNLFEIRKLLISKTYKPSKYTGFYIADPKVRNIHKAEVLDRVIHHIISNELQKIYEPVFYPHSYSSRKNKGIHKAVLALHSMALKESKNNTRICWILKCDIKKFYESVDHKILLNILSRKTKDKDFLLLLQKIIDSFSPGIPIGNLTSQYFSNIYLNELDQFIKHKLRVKYYIRYADDFVILSCNKCYLEDLIAPIKQFLTSELDLELHPNKTIFRKFGAGIDFLGYIIFPKFKLPRTKTKRRLIRKIKKKIKDYKNGRITFEKLNQTIQSYLGYLKHANTYKFRKELKDFIIQELKKQGPERIQGTKDQGSKLPRRTNA